LQPNLSPKDLKNTTVPFPNDITIIHLIVAEIEKRFSEAEHLEKSIDEGLEKAEALRQSILKSAFEGRLLGSE